MYPIYSHNLGTYTFRQEISEKILYLCVYSEGETGCTSEEDCEDINLVYMVLCRFVFVNTKNFCV